MSNITFEQYFYEPKEYQKISHDDLVEEGKLLVTAYYMATFDNMNEELINEGINDLLHKIGLNIEKEPGLIDYILGMAKGAGQLLIAAMKGDKKKVKEIASRLTKEKVLDFLLKLDMATYHFITGPIHMIDAITGWDLWANIEGMVKTSQDIIASILEKIRELKQKIAVAFDKARKTALLKELARLEAYIAPELKPAMAR